MVEHIICIVFASPFYPCGTINSKDVLLLTILGSSTSFRPVKDVLLLTILGSSTSFRPAKDVLLLTIFTAGLP